ncbi:MAG: DEAD/DEAH box helicase [Halobacteriaceae archaeon]
MTRGESVESPFEALGPAVRDALDTRGFTEATEPQRRAVPPIAAGEDALVVAPTGTGKTETAMLPIFDAVHDTATAGLAVLYVTPLRALNRDMQDRLEWWGDTLDLEVDVRHGDTTDYRRQQQANDPPDILVTTPETLQAMFTGSKLRAALETVEHVVVDEVHELAASKRGAQLSIALERLRRLAGPFQRVGLSATVGDPGEVGRFLTGDRGCTIVEVDVGSALDVEVRSPSVTDEDEELAGQLMCSPSLASHVRAIRDIIDAHASTLVFVNTRQTAEVLGSRLREVDADVAVHHGSLARDTRLAGEEAFKTGDVDALLCTSSMELGIDVGRVDHVVQYQSPREVARLVQRVGRAGHQADRVSRGTVVTGRPDDTLEAIAITARAERGAVEPVAIHRGSLDTLANQIAGLAKGTDGIDAREAYDLVTTAYPFRSVDEDTFAEVVRELADNRVLWLDEEADRIEPSGGTWRYVYANLSMIPDEESYDVYDIASGSQVGTLDERFVVSFAEPGATFVQRGEMWRIAEVDDEDTRVEVSPVEDPTGEVPSWTGQEIPVPASVAGDVGELRRVAATQLHSGASPDAVGREFARRYAAAPDTIATAVSTLDDHVGAGYTVPTDETVVIEREGRTVVVNAAFGHQINETLGRLIGALLGQRVGSSVGVDVDPYRIELELPSRLGAGDVREVLTDTDPDHVKPLVQLSVERAESLKFTLAQVAETFGALKPYRQPAGGDSRPRGLSADRLLDALEGTPVFEEALREVFHEELDAAGAASVLERIQSGDLDLVTATGRTPLGTDGRSSGQDLLSPEHADASVVRAVRDRLHDQSVRLVCLHCGDWDHETKVSRVRDQPRCPRCESTRIAALSPWADDAVAAVRADAGARDDDQEKLVERTHRNASIVQSHGRQAVIALAARGVGPQNAARVINNHRETEEEFYRDILRREREYARTKSFWD